MKKFLLSFAHAFRGIYISMCDRNMQVHVVATSLVVFFGFFFDISLPEWLTVLFCIILVFSLETVNCAIEHLSNVVRDEGKLSYEATKDPRDIAAGAVLIASIGSAVIGITIFLPYFVEILPYIIES